MGSRAGHKQVWVKVNAPVDEGVAPLVLALSEFEGVCTHESCQGGELAVVHFSCGEWRETATFVEDVLIPIQDGQDGLGIWSNVTVYDGDTVSVNLYVAPKNIGTLADLLSSSCRGRNLET